MTTIRPATPDDLPAIAAIYNDAVHTSVSTFDTEPRPPSTSPTASRSTRPGDHVLVVEDGSGPGILGFAYASTYRPRPRTTAPARPPSTCEDARGRGLGRALYSELLERVDADGIHAVVAVIAEPNPASEALHLALGFERVGALREVGRKFDDWVDTAFWQRLGPAGP